MISVLTIVARPTYPKFIGPNLQSNLQFFQALSQFVFPKVLIIQFIYLLNTYMHFWYLFFDSLILCPNLFSRNSTTLQTSKKATMNKYVHDEWILRVVNFLYKFTAMLRLHSQAVSNGMKSFLKEHSNLPCIWILMQSQLSTRSLHQMLCSSHIRIWNLANHMKKMKQRILDP